MSAMDELRREQHRIGGHPYAFEEINEILMYMNVHKVEVKTANFVESWGGAIFGLVTGLVQLKGYPSRKRFSQSFILAQMFG